MPCFSIAEAASAIARELIPAHHPDLDSAGVRVAFIFRDHAGKKGPKTILGRAAKRSLRDRFLSDYAADAVIELGEDTWNAMSPAARRALVDHELCHLEVVKKEQKVKVGEERKTITSGKRMGHVETVPIYEYKIAPVKDDDGRPKLALRPHDYEDFNAVIRRHGVWNTDTEAAFIAFISVLNHPNNIDLINKLVLAERILDIHKLGLLRTPDQEPPKP